MKSFSTSLREHAKIIIDFRKKKMLSLTKEEIKSRRIKDAKVCYMCRKILLKNAKDQNYWKVRNNCHYKEKYRGAAQSIFNLKFNVPNEIPIVFHNDSNYDYHFIILAN